MVHENMNGKIPTILKQNLRKEAQEKEEEIKRNIKMEN